MSDENPKII